MNRRLESERAADKKRREAHPWRKWYSTWRWFMRRARQLRDFPFCCKCWVLGKTRRATVADHKDPHRGDPLKFWYGELQSLCADCHDRAKQIEETEGFSRDIGEDGWPVDPRHPFNRTRPAGGGGSG